MPIDRALVGRDREIIRVMIALREGRSVVVEGRPGSGKSHLLSQVARSGDDGGLSTPIVLIEEERALWADAPVGSRGSGEARPAIDTSLDGTWPLGALLVVDDLDRLPDSVATDVVNAILSRKGQFLVSATSFPSTVSKTAPLSRLLLRSRLDCVSLGPLSYPATRQLASDLCRTLGAEHVPEDAWFASLHRLTGGVPALIIEVMSYAVPRERISALDPLDLRFEPVPEAIARSTRRLLAALSESQRCALALLGELGAVPSSHLPWFASPTDVSALSDAMLLSGSVEPGYTAATGLGAWLARQSVDASTYREHCLAASRQLLSKSARGLVLTAAEERLCSLHSDGIPLDELGEAEVAALSGVLEHSALALARSATPRDAIPLAERALRIGPSLVADASLILASGVGDSPEAASERLARLGRPANREQAELHLQLLLAHTLIPGTPAELTLSLAQDVRSWFPSDRSWQVRMDGMERVLCHFSGTIDVDRFEEVDIDAALKLGPGVYPDDLARRAAGYALVEALKGRFTRAMRLIEPRLRSHGLDMEPHLEIFSLHAYILVTLGEESDRLRRALRRRLVSARSDGRQDQVHVLALIDATLQLQRGDARGMLFALALVEGAPHVSLAIWLDLLRACAHILMGDPTPAAGLLTSVAHVPNDWDGWAFAAVRELARVIFETATGQTSAARERAMAGAQEFREKVPPVAVALLERGLALGAPAEEVLRHAKQLPSTVDLPPHARLIAELERGLASAGTGAWHVLTAREREVASLAADGLTNAEIARRLQLSVRTVESHLHHARSRLGMTRSQRFER